MDVDTKMKSPMTKVKLGITVARVVAILDLCKLGMTKVSNAEMFVINVFLAYIWV